jgi:glutamyl-Q tRNA(Asp) synthetase
MTKKRSPYRGRFAPSPTGPLHFGSLVAAVGSYLEARQRGGEWLVRMEDLDPPREVPGADKLILDTLEHYGFEWDGEVIYQSRRGDYYLDALDHLQRRGLLYRCDCSRKEIAERGKQLGLAIGVYPGTCRTRQTKTHQQHALRLLIEGEQVEFRDAIQGTIKQNLAEEVGDFVLRRADGLFAYQLAVVVDDSEQGITEVVRGSDLLGSTPRQILLQHYLGYPTPDYRHLPIAVNAEGLKLSKQTFAPALEMDNPLLSLWQALQFLGQQPPEMLLEGELNSFWQWSLSHWRSEAVPHKLVIPVDTPQ